MAQMASPTTAPLMVFDLDGTLVDSVPDIAAAVNRMFAVRGLAPLTVSSVAAMVGDGLHALLERAFAARSMVPDAAPAADYMADYEANVAVETALFPGMRQTLARLAETGWHLAVCTNKPVGAARLLLAALQVDHFF